MASVGWQRYGKYPVVWSLLLACWVASLTGCQTAPITGRQQLILLSETEETHIGLSTYQQILKEERLSRDARYNALVTQVGQRIAAVANRPDYAWEFRVLDKDIANAFALPGGKIAVYTGLFKYTQNEAGLATVLAHEIAHALARHGAERVSQNMLGQLTLNAIQAGLQSGDSVVTQGIALAYGVGVALPFNRSQESEADRIGLILMAQAGYDPHEAIALWQRMGAGQPGTGPPEFLSTHPSEATRIQQLERWLPEALPYYTRARQR